MKIVTDRLTAAGGRFLAPIVRSAFAAAAITFTFAIAMLGMSASALARPESSSVSSRVGVNSLPNIVLVHGAWADGSSWSEVIRRLQATGYNVVAPQLPETSLADDVARVRAVLAGQTGPTILVGHSYGGEVISALGKEAPNVVGLVYVAAFGLDQGESLAGISSQGPPMPSAAEIKPDAKGFLYLSQEGFLKYFAPDADPSQARLMFAVQQPLAGSIFAAQVGEPSWKSLPSWYLVTTDDQMIAPAAQMLLAQRMKATIQTVASSHVPMISHPDAVVKIIETAAGTGSGNPTITNAPATPTTAPAQSVSIPGAGSQTFAETGKAVTGVFLDYWKQNGGLMLLGYPLSDLMIEKSPLDGKAYTVQYFERAVLEYHPENQAPYNVLLSQLGTFRYQELYPRK